MNTGTSISATTPQEAIVHAPTPSPIPTIINYSFATEVDQLVNTTTTLTMEESTPPTVSTKRVRDEDQQSLWAEGSPKRSCVSEDDAYGEVNPS